MAQVKLLKIAADGVPLEMDSASDDITLNSFTVQGGGPVLSGTGLDMNNQDISDVQDLAFNNPASGTINQTAGNLIIDNIMAKERSNSLTTAADILFPAISDNSGQVDALRLPAIAGPPTATPTTSGEGFFVWDSTNDNLYVWTGSAWSNQSLSATSKSIDDSYTTDGVGVTIRDAVYISAAGVVTSAINTSAAAAQVVGFATSTVGASLPVTVRKFGRMSGFTGLTAGARYFLDSTAGLITSTIPSASGASIVQAGYAFSTTALDIMIQQLGRRA